MNGQVESIDFNRLIFGSQDSPQQSTESTEWDNSRLKMDWHTAVGKQPFNDFLTVLSASSKTGVSGSGKTTLGTRLAKRMDLTEDGFDAEEKSSLSISEIAYDILPDVEDRSAVLWDEAQGLVGASGLDSRRGMREESLDAIKSILGNRGKSLSIIIIAQQFSYLDKRLYPLVDAWLLIRRAPGSVEGPLGTYHKVHVQDYNLSSPKIKTPAVEDFSWNPLPEDDEDYQIMESQKQMAKSKNGYAKGKTNSIKELPKKARNAEIERLYDESGFDQNQLASIFGVNQSTISRILSD